MNGIRIVQTMSLLFCASGVLGCDRSSEEPTRVSDEVRCESAILRSGNLIEVSTRSGYELRFSRNYLADPMRFDSQCRLQHATFRFIWYQGRLFASKIEGQHRHDIPLDDVVWLGQEFTDPTQVPVRPEVPEWKLADAIEYPEFGVTVLPRSWASSPDSTEYMDSEFYRVGMLVSGVPRWNGQPVAFDLCLYVRDADYTSFLEFSAGYNGCRGSWSIAPGARGPVDVGGGRVLLTIRAKLLKLAELTDSFVVREEKAAEAPDGA